MNEVTEIFLPIPQFPNYEASTLGNIRSVDRFRENKRYPGFLIKVKGRLLSVTDNGKGYKCVHIGYVHRLVAFAFLPNPNNLPEVNHKDGNKANNCLYNLEWVSHADNQKHAGDNGLMARGERVAGAKLNPEIVMDIFNNPGTYLSTALKFGVSEGQVGKIKRKIRWKHIH